MVIIKKRAAIIAAVTLLVCVAVFLNWSYNGSPPDTTGDDQTTEYTPGDESQPTDAENSDAEGVTGSSAYFSEARLTRQQARDEALSILKTTTDSTEADSESKQLAGTEVSMLASNAVKEARIENLVKAKGFADCVAFIGASDINVVVASPEEGLSVEDVAKIRDIVISETKLGADSIKIVEVK